MRIGFDIDGVLADFNTSYIETVIRVTGRDLFPARPFDILTWNYPESYGYTKDEVSKVWADIKANPFFWADLDPYPDTREALAGVQKLEEAGHDLYFVTARPGIHAKAQTEAWLLSQTYTRAIPQYTVLIASDKGAVAKALNLDYYIDDKFENVVDVVATGTRTYLLNRTWNMQGNPLDVTRVPTVGHFIADILGTPMKYWV